MIVTVTIQLASEQAIVNEMESTLRCQMVEHEQVEAQIQTEHDEEVQALHQQKQQLVRQLEDTKLRYSQSIKEQDQHVRSHSMHELMVFLVYFPIVYTEWCFSRCLPF